MNLLDIFSDKLAPADQENITEFLELMFEPDVDEESLIALNPLSQIEIAFEGGNEIRFLAFKFRRIMAKRKITNLICTVTDVTEQVQLSQKLEESRSQSKRQMDWLLSILHVEPQLLKEFIDGVNAELKYIDSVLREENYQSEFSDLLEKIYRSMHLIKGNASVLDLKFFVEKAHDFEDKLAELRAKQTISGSDFVPLVLQLSEIKQTVYELNNLIERISKIHSHFRPKRSYESEVFIRSIQNLVRNISTDMNKKIKLIHDKFDAGIIPYELKLTVREIIIQLVRNSIYHGIESPAERRQKHKTVPGIIEIENIDDDQDIGIKLRDDGRGLQISKLREKAIDSGKWKRDEVASWSDKQVVDVIFTTGISTLNRANLVAGRGVGLDIVKNKVERLYGQVKVEFKADEFTEFTIIFPRYQEQSEDKVQEVAAVN
jgi:chemotaxis protein histidine kinase CheA